MSSNSAAAGHVDVIIVGAGLSGVGAAYRLQTECPDKSYAILEARDAVGGTWDLFRYPGIRSDSDMYTLSFPYRPWKNPKSIADGHDIRTYIEGATADYGIDSHIRFGHRVVSASWSSDDARWTVTSLVDGTETVATANFLYLCSGYYSYDAGYTPEFPGIGSFEGQVIHPQQWPTDLDYAGKKVVVVGSGATAVTLVPSMADDVEHITMLQRSPSYVMGLPATDKVADFLRKTLPDGLAHRTIRRINAGFSVGMYQFCQRFPTASRKLLLKGVRKQLPEGYDVDTHFSPTYGPWDQRLCIVPDGDLFRSLRQGKASIATGHIKQITPAGIELESGEHLDADIIVTATGLQVVTFGQLSLEVDGAAIDPHELYVYKGMMFSGLPNLAWCVGYTNASWTLRADLTSQYVCKLINHLDAKGYDFGMPDPSGAAGSERPLLDLTSGYVQRVASTLPKQGNSSPWTIRQNWFLDSYDMRRTDLEQSMVFGVRSRSSVSA
ncbi:flavin-containing monooxygenase [Aeromicrobium sp.]|uniref:flavin-containing monooxygenase n=1 Tax=Aeromicrobium sp. TaxID=1871063 RepID=UPI003C3CD683